MRHFYLGVIILLAFSQSAFSQSKRSINNTSKPKVAAVTQPKEDSLPAYRPGPPPLIAAVTQSKKDSLAEKEMERYWLFRDTDNLTTLIGYILVAVATGLTFTQWRADQKWKRKEALMNRVTSFDATPGVWNALLMLGTSDRNVPLWDKEKPEEKYVRVTRREVATALLPHEFLAITYCPKETAIRDSFDDFLKRLSHLEAYREEKLLNEDEINSAIHYWPTMIKKLVASSDTDDQALSRNLFLYIYDKEMTKVIALFKAFGIPLEDTKENYQLVVQQEIVDNKWHRLSQA